MSWNRFLDSLVEMAKPRIMALLVVIAATAFVAEGGFRPGGPGWGGLAVTVFSVGLLSVGIFTLNHWMERREDRSMARTRDRPLAAGRFPAPFALAWGLGFTALSLGFSWWAVNPTMALVALATAVGYLLVYTPLKYRTSFHTALGALPGATPPLAGALAATGTLSDHAWLLYAVLVFWQFPHFLSIELLYREDYGRGSIQVVPVVDRTGTLTAVQILGATTGLGVLGWFLFPSELLRAVALVLTGILLAAGWGAVVGSRSPTEAPGAARRLLRASVVYLPLLFVLVVVQTVFWGAK